MLKRSEGGASFSPSFRTMARLTANNAKTGVHPQLPGPKTFARQDSRSVQLGNPKIRPKTGKKRYVLAKSGLRNGLFRIARRPVLHDKATSSGPETAKNDAAVSISPLWVVLNPGRRSAKKSKSTPQVSHRWPQPAHYGQTPMEQRQTRPPQINGGKTTAVCRKIRIFAIW